MCEHRDCEHRDSNWGCYSVLIIIAVLTILPFFVYNP